MKKVLITGGSSFLGGYLVKAAQPYFQVFATYFNHQPSYPGVEWIHLNLLYPQKIEGLVRAVRPHLVLHNAALTDVDHCEEERELVERVNIRSCDAISRISRQAGARLFYISTDMIFEGANPPYQETDEPHPLNHYGWSKWQGEKAIAKNNPDQIIIRAALMYGPPAVLGSSFSEWMRKSWEEGKATLLFTDQFRTPIFAGNLAQAVLELARVDFKGVIHLGGGERLSRYQFGLMLAEFLGLGRSLIQPALMSEVKLRGRRPADLSLSTDLARKILNTRLLGCEEGIRAAYLKNVSSRIRNKA